MPLARWLGRSYLRAAIAPLLLIELSFVAIYWVSSNFTYDRNAEAIGALSKDYLTDIANREATTIQATIDGVANMATLLSHETIDALATDFEPPASEKARYAMSPEGVFHTVRGKDESASFFSGHVPVGPAEKEKVWRTYPLDSVMRSIKNSSPLVRQVYVNTHDSYNRIYPYFNVLEQYAPGMNIPSYNFYYEADAKHNPARKTVWTDAYVDPAGGGWMVSAIAPAYSDTRLEAVIGIDLTVDTLIHRILDLKLPWHGYAVLISRDGTILALPPAGEVDLGLKELKNHHYSDAIRSDTFKPEQFNITKRREFAPLADAIRSGRQKVSMITLSGKRMLAANAAIPGPGWQLVVIAPEDAILANATSLRDRLQTVGLVMILILLLFYAGFFFYLAMRARVMSRRVAEPLKTIETLMDSIGAGEYDHDAPKFGVTELDRVSDRLVRMGTSLGAAHRRIVDQENAVRTALESEKRVTHGQRRFIDILSHEFRTPLTVIDSSAQILRRRAARLTEESVLERSDTIRRAASRIDDVMKSALQLVQLEEGGIVKNLHSMAADTVVRQAIETVSHVWPGTAILFDGETSEERLNVDPVLIRTALAALLENACKFSREGKTVNVAIAYRDDVCRITIRDQGLGIAADELPMVRERFFRGTNSTAVPGAGVGLYLATMLIEAHSGTLDISSEVGQGTDVSITLPIARQDALDISEAA